MKPIWFDLIDEGYKEVLSEVYSAIDHKLYFLASSGTRTALDQLIVEQVGDVGTFQKKMNMLVEEKIIDTDEKDMLFAVIDAGSASAHRSFKPDTETIGHMMDILESVFCQLLIEPIKKQRLKEKAKELRKVTPPREQA